MMRISSDGVDSQFSALQELFEIVSRGKEMWEATFDAIRDPVMLIDREYRIVRANLEASRRSDVPIQQLIGKRCYEVFAKKSEVCPGCPLQKTMATEFPQSEEILDWIDGGDFQVNSYPLLKTKEFGEPLFVHHYRDITEERRLQKQLIQSEKMVAIGMLAGGMAHEINNPLAGILAFAQILKKELPPDSVCYSDVGEIEEAAKRCKKIVEDLLLFARPCQEGEWGIFSLDVAIEKILPLARLNLRHCNVSLVTEYENPLPFLRGSSAWIQQVFFNLIQNAAQSMRQGGEVMLRIRHLKERNEVVAEVIDQGCGIKKENLAHIFDPFFSTKKLHEGTGLGLWISYSIISEHGGRIEVESEEGKGSLFRVILPVDKGVKE